VDRHRASRTDLTATAPTTLPLAGERTGAPGSKAGECSGALGSKAGECTGALDSNWPASGPIW
jgi:hypothetical protein